MPPIGPQKRNPFTMATPKAPPKLLNVKKKPPVPTVQGMVDTFGQSNKVVKQETAQKKKLAGELLQGMSNTVTQSFVSSKDNSLGDYYKTVSENPNATPDEIMEVFPEFRGKADVLGDYYLTIRENPNASIEEIRAAFPEIYELPKVQPKEKEPNRLLGAVKKGAKLISPIANVVDTIGAENIGKFGVGFAQGASDVGQGIFSSAGSLLNKPIEALGRNIANPIRRAIGKENLTQEQSSNMPTFSDTMKGDITTLLPEEMQDGVVGAGREVGKIGASAALTYPLGAVKGVGLLGRAALGATEGVLGTAAYNVASGNEAFNKTSGIAGLIGGAIPIIGKGVSKLPVLFGKTAEGLSMKGLLNASDAKKIINTLKETGEGDIGSLSRRALKRKIVGKSTEEAIEKLASIKYTNYNNVRKAVNSASSKIGVLGVDDTVRNAMITVGKNTDAINTRMGFEAVSKAEIDDIMRAAQDGSLTLSQKQRSKELIDEFVNIYKKSGEVADTQIADQADRLRRVIKESIEDLVTKATNGRVNVREMNREVAVAQNFIDGIGKKAVANELRQFAIQGSTGGILGSGGEFRPLDPKRWSRVLLGVAGGRLIGKLTTDPRVMGKIATYIDNLSFGSRNNIIEYMKAPTKVKLTEQALEDVFNIKKAIAQDEEITTAIKLLKEGPLESNPLRLTTTTKTRTLGPGATQQTTKPLSSNILNNASNMSDNLSTPSTTTTSGRLGVLSTVGKKKPTKAPTKAPSILNPKKSVQSDALTTKSDSMSNPIVNERTGETLNEAIEKMRKNKRSEKDIAKYKDAVLGKNDIKKDPNVLDTLNPTGGLYVKYDPKKRATMELADNITTLDKTMKVSPDDEITIYRGTVKSQKDIVPGDFITTNYDLAKSYAGEGKVISKKVKASEILDDINEPLGDEYIYRPSKPSISKDLQPQEIDLMASELSERFKMRKELVKKWIEKDKPDFGEIANAIGKRDNNYLSKIQEKIFNTL